MVSPGSIVHVAPGTYAGVTTSVSGTSSARIRFISDVKWGAKVRSAGIAQVWQNGGSYVDIMGFDISGDGRLGILNEGSFVRIIGNLVHDIPAAGNGAGGRGGAGIDNDSFTAGDNEVIGNVVHDIGNPAVPGSEIQGIYHSNPRGHIVNNIVYRVQAWGIHLWHAADEVVIANNLVFQNGEGGILVGAGDAPGGITDNHTVVVNNMVVANHDSWGSGIAIYEFGATGTANRYLDNLIWNNSQGIVLQNGLIAAGTINADPLFVNYQPDGSGDYHLQPGSRAIHAGAMTDCPALDFDGAPRPFGSAPDIGVYEFGAAPAAWPWM
jgi:Right handed beta helix region